MKRYATNRNHEPGEFPFPRHCKQITETRDTDIEPAPSRMSAIDIITRRCHHDLHAGISAGEEYATQDCDDCMQCGVDVIHLPLSALVNKDRIAGTSWCGRRPYEQSNISH